MWKREANEHAVLRLENLTFASKVYYKITTPNLSFQERESLNRKHNIM